MRGRTVLISTLAHGLAFVGLSRCELDLERPPPPRDGHGRPPALVLVPAPVDVVLLEPAPPAHAPAASAAAIPDPTRAPRGGGATPRRLAASSGAPSRATPSRTAEPGPGPAPGPTGLLRMRGLRHDLRLPGTALDRIAGAARPAAPAPAPAPEPTAHTAKLRPRGEEHVIRDRVATVDVAPDGTVDIADLPDVTIRLNLPTPTNLARHFRRFKREFKAWQADPYRITKLGPSQELPRHLTAVPGACDRWFDPMCAGADDVAQPWEDEDEASASGALISGKLDISSALHRKLVGDPYASRKLKLVDLTRDERVRIGTVHRAQQRARSAELVRRNLEALWRTTRDPAERRAALFALWDECTEGEGPAGEAGERARAMVIGWIRARIPRGSPGGYRDDEIAALDARRTSRQHFVPYR